MEDTNGIVRSAADSRPVRFGPVGVISPELALIDPAAAAAARAALPDEPWNVALHRARTEWPRKPPEAPRVACVEDVPPDRPLSSQRVGVAAIRRLSLMVVWIVMITGTALVAELRSPDAPALEAGAASVPASTTHPAAPAPGSGYVIGPRSGFRVGPQGRAIGSLTLPVPCLWGVPLGRVVIADDMTFSFRRSVRSSGGPVVRVWFAGHFASPSTALGTVTVRGAGCTRRRIPFVARLS